MSQEIARIESQEVMTELEFRSCYANEEHRAVERDAASMLDHAIRSGEHLEAGKAQFSELEVRRGDWGKWLETNFEGSRSTAQLYMRLARNKDALGARRAGRLSIAAAEKMLAEPKEEKPKSKPSLEPDDEVEDVEIVYEEPTITLPDGRVVTLVEAEQLLRQKTLPPKVKIGKRELTEQEVKEEFESLLARQNEAEERRRLLETALTEREEKWARDYAEELARIQDKYGINTEPEVMDIPGEVMADALSKAPSIRLQKAGLAIIQLMRAQTETEQYSPEDAVLAVELMPTASCTDVHKRVLTLSAWLADFEQELSQRTTRGVRVVK